MDRIAYVVQNNVDGKAVYASFDKVVANANTDDGQTVKAIVVDPADRVAAVLHRLDPLKVLCLSHSDVSEDTIVYLSVSKPGGMDGMDRFDRGGAIRFASFDRAQTERRLNAWTTLTKEVVNPAEICAATRASIDAIDLMCMDEEIARAAEAEADRAAGPRMR